MTFVIFTTLNVRLRNNKTQNVNFNIQISEVYVQKIQEKNGSFAHNSNLSQLSFLCRLQIPPLISYYR